jgi:hypothetical protein
MRFSNPASKDLGVYTWAALQAEFPHDGGALAALPNGVTAFVSDWGTAFTPNAAKTKWRPVGGKFVLGQAQGSLASPVASITGVTVVTKFGITSLTVPADLTWAGVKLDCKAAFRKTGTNGTWTWNWRLGTGNTSSDNSLFDGSNNISATDARIDTRALITSATGLTAIRRGSLNGSSGGNTAIDISGGTLDAEADQYINWYVTPGSGSDTFALVDYQIVVEYPL